VLRQRRPERDLVVAADAPLEVEAPGLHRGRAEAERRERDLHLRAPADVGYARTHLPRGVPVQVETALAAADRLALRLARDLAVVLDAGRIGAEHVAVLAIQQSVDQDSKAVGVVERGVATAVG